MGIYLDDYRIRLVNNPVDCKALWVRKDSIAFYRAHFEVGLRLPIDPFICEFLKRTNSARIDINIHTI